MLRIVGLAMLTACGLAGCSEYLERRDTISLGAGEAVQTNMVQHVIDPWPAHARRVQVATDGERAQRAVERYRNPRSGAGAGGDVAPPPQAGGASPARAP